MTEKNVDLLRELRYVASEVGLREAKKMSVEVRRWWIEEMRKEAEQKATEFEALQGKRTVDAK